MKSESLSSKQQKSAIGAKQDKTVKTAGSSILSKAPKKVIWDFPLQKQNFIILGIGAAVIIIGFLLMSTGMTNEPSLPEGKWNSPVAIVIAPIMLLLGYCVIIPYAILKIFRNKDKQNEAQNNQ
jgi:NADH:ubiquinone oxidoreductase subunit 6 (subunit J)